MKKRKNNISKFYVSILIGGSLLFGGMMGVIGSPEVWAYETQDMGAEVLSCRVTQRGSSDCAVASMATMEAYLNGLTGDDQHAYDAIWNKNGQQGYIRSWGDLGYRTYSLAGDFQGDVSAFCKKMYGELKKGMPCAVRRNSAPTHYSVIVGYSGDGESFHLGDFTILEVHSGASEEKALKNLEDWMNNSGATALDQLVIRQGGIGEINRGDDSGRDEPEKPVQLGMTIEGEGVPNTIHKMGAPCIIKGTIASGNPLQWVNAKVCTAEGKEVFSKRVEPTGKRYNLAAIDREVPISGLGTGSYVYVVSAADITGHEETLLRVPFAVMENPVSQGDSATRNEKVNLITLQIREPLMYKNGTATEIDDSGTTPILQQGATLLPLRAVMESMGASLVWDGKQQRITVDMKGKTLHLQIGKKEAWDEDGRQYPLSAEPCIVNGRTMMPIRVVAEYFGGMVEWSPSAQMVAVVYR